MLQLSNTKKLIKLIFFIYLSFTSALLLPALAQPYITYSVNSSTMQDLLKNLDQSSLVMINIDDTIITPKNIMLRYHSIYRNFMNDIVKGAEKNLNLRKAVAAYFLQRKIMLVEPNWPEFIEKLKNTGALVYGIHAINPGLYYITKDPEDFIYQEIQSLGINFTQTIGNQTILKVPLKMNQYGFFYKGILFASELTRNQALLSFLKFSNIMPTKIIIIDVNKHQLQSINNLISNVRTDYYPVNYIGIENLQMSTNPDIINLQQQTLINQNQWLEDDEAELILKTQNQQR